MRIMSIASGSSGNCIYIGTNSTHILLDAGITRKKICEGLKKADIAISDIDAVFVTHEHSDHIKGLGVMSRCDEIPIYASKGTIMGIESTPSLGEVPNHLLNPINTDTDICIGDITIHSFKVSHDANEPTAYTFSSNHKKAGVITDLGCFTDYTIDNLTGADALLVEANHDINLLQVGRYPFYLKQRILSNKGHLSNESCGRLINNILNDNIQNIFLGHLSKENNYDKLAYETVRQEIDMSENSYKSKDFNIQVALRDQPSEIVTL